MQIANLKQQRESALAKGQVIAFVAACAERPLTESERRELDGYNAEVDALTPQIAALESSR